jgi:Fur family ferric uptake transcriptional regulator
MTAQRRAVAEALTGVHLHLTADEVYERAGEILPELSRATVYNTLNELVEMGEVQVLSFDGGNSRRYDPNAVSPHHHLSCRSCGLVLDVTGAQFPELTKRQRQGFDVEHTHVVFEGLCTDCRPKRRGSAAKA